jgi:hypothetical protein
MRYRFFGCLIAIEVLALAFLVAAGHFTTSRNVPVHRDNQQLVKVLELTDLSIWTGARYTRHLSQADVFSAFQDSMGALEHFPAGVLASPPASIVDRGGDNEPTS